MSRSGVWAVLTAVLLLPVSCRLFNRAPSRPSAPLGPDNCVAWISYRFTTLGVDPDGDDLSGRFDWGDGDTSEWVGPVAAGDSVAKTHTWRNPGTYAVRAQVMDPRARVSAWSDSLVVAVGPNTAPLVPVIASGPNLVEVNRIYAFTVVTTDPDSGDVSYRFDWGDGDTSGWSRWVASGRSATDYHEWRTRQTTAVRAQARDRGRGLSPWSEPWPVRASTPPYPPLRPAGPLGRKRGTTLTFSTSAEDPEGDSIAIRFAWDDGDTSEWSELVLPGATVSATHTWSQAGTYNIAAQARDNAGALSLWSRTREVTIDGQEMRVRWCYATGDAIITVPAVDSAGNIYVGSMDRQVYAFAPDGTRQWFFRTNGSIQSSPAIGPDGTIYVGSDDDYLYALNPDGTQQWRYRTQGSVRSSPAIGANGTIYVGSDDDCLYALNPDGSRRWRFNCGGNVRSSPAIGSDGTIYVGSDDDCLYALNPDSTLRWRVNCGGNVRSSPAIGSDGTIYVGSDDDAIYAFNPDSTLRWRLLTFGGVQSSPAVGPDGTVYVGSDDKGLYAVGPDGRLEWVFDLGGNVRSSPAIAADGTVYIGSDRDRFCAVRPDNTLEWEYETGGNIAASPTILADGSGCFGSDDGYLYVLAGSAPLAATPWPKFRRDLANRGRVPGRR